MDYTKKGKKLTVGICISLNPLTSQLLSQACQDNSQIAAN